MTTPPSSVPPSPPTSPEASSALPTLPGTFTDMPLTILIFVIIIRSFLSDSLWLDEAISAWVTNESLPDVVSRAITYQGQSPFYFIILWCSEQVFGRSEIALRLPSVIFLGVAAALLFVMARRALSSNAAWISTFVFLLFDDVLVSMSARPYALALMCSLASILFLVRWSETQRISDGTLWLVSSLATLYAHYLFAGVVLVHFTYLLATRSRLFETRRYQVTLLCIIGTILSYPAITHLLSLAARRTDLYFAARPSVASVAQDIMPLYLAVYLGCSIAITVIQVPAARLRRSGSTAWLITLLVWHIAPPVLFAILSTLGDGSLAVSRLYSWHLAGLALLVGWGLTSLAPPSAMRWAIAVLCLLGTGREMGRRWQLEDWRSAIGYLARATPATEPIIAYSGLIELNNESWLLNTNHWSYLSAPFSYYRLPNPVTPLPPSLTVPPKPVFAEQVLKPLLTRHTSITLIARQQRGRDGLVSDRLVSEISSRGWREVGRKVFGLVVVVHLSRNQGVSPPP